MSFFHRKRDKPAKASAKPGDSLGHITIQSSESFAPSRTRSPSPSRSPSSLPSGAPTVPAPTQHRDLWKEAFDSLDESQRNSLEDESTRSKKSSLDIVDSVIDLTENEYKDYCTRGWHISKGDKTRETNVRIQAKVILCSALQFKDVIEAGLKFDPSGYGTIAWGVISGGLQLLQNERIGSKLFSVLPLRWLESCRNMPLSNHSIGTSHCRNRRPSRIDSLLSTLHCYSTLQKRRRDCINQYPVRFILLRLLCADIDAKQAKFLAVFGPSRAKQLLLYRPT